MNWFHMYADQIVVSALLGLTIGLCLKLNVWVTGCVSFFFGGVVSLAVTGDWSDFLKEGMSLGHLIYLMGYVVISVVYFGPFGCIASLGGRFMRGTICGRAGSSQ